MDERRTDRDSDLGDDSPMVSVSRICQLLVLLLFYVLTSAEMVDFATCVSYQLCNSAIGTATSEGIVHACASSNDRRSPNRNDLSIDYNRTSRASSRGSQY